MREKVHQIIIGGEVMLLCMVVALLSTQAASSNPPSNGVSYNKNEQVTVENALDNLYTKANYGNATANDILNGKTALVGGKEVVGTFTCPTLASQTPGDATAADIDEGKIAWVNGEKIIGSRIEVISNRVKLGDYIRYTPSKTSYTIKKLDTRYTEDQTINPSELNLWQVIRKNENGTIEIVSSSNSKKINLGDVNAGKQALEDLSNDYLEILYDIASAYRTVGYTAGSRCMNSSDLNLVSVYVGKPWDCWVASKEDNMVQIVHSAPEVRDFNSVFYNFLKFDLCAHDGGVSRCDVSMQGLGIRPIVVLKANLKITSGEGTKFSPYTLGT